MNAHRIEDNYKYRLLYSWFDKEGKPQSFTLACLSPNGQPPTQ